MPVPSSKFTFCMREKSLVAEASTIGAVCDTLEITSTHTGRTVRFVQIETVKDREGDIEGWMFAPAKGQDAGNVKTVFVLND